MVMDRGWDLAEYDCLVALWNRESHWNVYAENPTSGAYGIPQALPGNKMATVAADWQTNPADADHLGTRLHRGALRHPVRRVGPLGAQGLVLRQR